MPLGRRPTCSQSLFMRATNRSAVIATTCTEARPAPAEEGCGPEEEDGEGITVAAASEETPEGEGGEDVEGDEAPPPLPISSCAAKRCM